MRTKVQSPEDYYEWLQKFDKKLTTDETFTPPEIYQAVQEWVCKRYNVDKECIVRPFYPEGDYVNEDYSGKVVVDNPPFSIVAQIVQFYMERDIPFFLFCPYLTAFSLLKYGASVVAQGHEVSYANGANIRTGFVTNLEPFQKVFTNIELKQAVEGKKKRDAVRTRNVYPKGVYIISNFNTLADKGVDIEIDVSPTDMRTVLYDSEGGVVRIFGGCIDIGEFDELESAIRRNANERELFLDRVISG